MTRTSSKGFVETDTDHSSEADRQRRRLSSTMRTSWASWDVAVVVAVFMEMLLSCGPVYNYNIFFVHLQKEFGTTAMATGWMGSLGATLFCLASPLSGYLGSRLGYSRVVLLGTVMSAVGYILTSFIPALPYGYLTYGLLAGLGTCFVFAGSTSVMLAWFTGRPIVCRALGLGSMGASVGVMVFGPLLNTLSAVVGWRNCMLITGVMVLVIGVVTGLPLLKSPGGSEDSHQKDRRASEPPVAAKETAEPIEDEPSSTQQTSREEPAPTPRTDRGKVERTQRAGHEKPERTSPKESIVEPDEPAETQRTVEKNNPNEGNDQEDPSQGLQVICEMDPERSPKTGTDEPSVKTDDVETAERAQQNGCRALGDVDAWLWVLGTSFAQLGWSFLIINFASFMKESRLSVDEISTALALSGGAEVAGKFLFAVIGDYLPFRTIYIPAISSAGGAITAGFLTLSTTLLHMVTLAIAWGFFRGLLYAPGHAACLQLFPQYDPGTVSSIGLLGYGLGVIITGSLRDLTGDYTLSLLVLVCAFVTSLACFLLIPIRRKLVLTCCRRCRQRDDVSDTETALDKSVADSSTVVRHVGTYNPAYELDIM